MGTSSTESTWSATPTAPTCTSTWRRHGEFTRGWPWACVVCWPQYVAMLRGEGHRAGQHIEVLHLWIRPRDPQERAAYATRSVSVLHLQCGSSRARLLVRWVKKQEEIYAVV